ncbi:MAG: class I SAM-dependent DNA methyltransferase [Pseudodesulfovibrio sp.]|nr:class I SAM-dependent DNA methyltransferase [Pseudodesulfovibrio sp.]
MAAPVTIDAFIDRWSKSGGSEQGNSQLFLVELCDILGMPKPDPSTPDYCENTYSFERKVPPLGAKDKETWKRLDLYKKGCFIFESKQGQDKFEEPRPVHLNDQARSSAVKRGSRAWRSVMDRAKRQAETYVKALPSDEGRPPFIIVGDVGYCFEIYSEFSCTGGNYIPFPDGNSNHIPLEALKDKETRELLKGIWLEPHSLDPTKEAEKVTKEIARHLAELARSLEEDEYSSEDVATFLIRCLFTLFSEDVGLLPPESFQSHLEKSYDSPEIFKVMTEDLWKAMNSGSISVSLGQKLRRFNGSVFSKPKAYDLSKYQISILLEAAKADWRDVEPSIFGTMIEQALMPKERHKLGAHYTPREYVERLVLPAVVEPIRDDWKDVQSAAELLSAQGKQKEAQKEILKFHRKLCSIHVLDPACGTGNFLYVAMEHFKRLEVEVLNEAKSYGETQMPLEVKGHTILPEQFLGIELNERAAYIAEMVLWIGHWQWQIRSHGKLSIEEPILRKYRNIECRDAILEYDSTEPVVDEDGNTVTRWDGVTTKTHPVTGEQVPDEEMQVPILKYINPCKAQWPNADFVVGNPPFIGNKRMRLTLGDGYTECLRNTWKDVPDTSDFVMYWWHQAAEMTRNGELRRFGFITTNSLTMAFNRRLLQQHLKSSPALSLAFAISDHPWVNLSDGAAVRIAMTVGKPASEGVEGTLASVIAEHADNGKGTAVELDVSRGIIHADLTAKADVASAGPLSSNEGLSFMGVILVGSGFIVEAEESLIEQEPGVVKPYLNGRDITQKHVVVTSLTFLD